MTPQPPISAWSWPRRLSVWLYEQRWLLAIFFAALFVRLHWNLVVHPPGDYIFSDMNGYVTRADRMLRDPFTPHEYSAFFPWGTHAMLAALKWLVDPAVETGFAWVDALKADFDPDPYPKVGIVYALMGALTVAFAYAIARRASQFKIVPPAVGLLGVFYYPHLSLGGYMLSEVPFCLALTGCVLFVLRLIDDGRHRDAWLLGLTCGLGALFRPQILLSAAAVGAFFLIRRRSMGKLRLVHFVQAAVPLALLLGVSSMHLHHHTGRRGLVSENGSFNLVFGRCHNVKIESLPDGKGRGHVHFKPPPFLQVRNIEIEAAQRRVPPEVALEGALGEDIVYEGYIGDKDIHREFIRQCIDKTGISGQLAYSWLNVKLLWMYNIAWPDSGRAEWRPPARWWSLQQKVWFAIPALLGLLWMFVPGPRRAKLGVVSVNLLAILVLAAVVFGGARHRTPYDYFIILLAFETYAFVGFHAMRAAARWIKRRQAPGEKPRGPSSSQDSSSG